MFQYIVNRILIFIPTFFAISLIIFGLSKMAPGDPVEVLLSDGPQGGSGGQSLLTIEEGYLIKAKKLGLDKPAFYFTFTSAAYPKDLYKIVKMEHRELVSRLISKYGNSDDVMKYYEQLRKVLFIAVEIPETEKLYDIRRLIRRNVDELFKDFNEKTILFKLDTLKKAINSNYNSALSDIKKEIPKLSETFSNVKKNVSKYKLYTPRIHFYGFDNQYHTWMFGDYPWFQTVDSSAYLRVEKLYADISKLNNRQDSISRIQKPYIAKNKQLEEFITANDSTKVFSPKEIDSLVALKESIQINIANFNRAISPLLKEITVLNKEKDLLSKRVKLYTGKGFLRGDFGSSYTNGLPVTKRLTDAVFWTLLMNIFSIIVSYIISIPLGVQSAHWKRNSERFEPLLSLEAFIGSILMVILFYAYLNSAITANFFYSALISINVLFMLFALLVKEKANQGNLTVNSLGRFWFFLISFRFMNLADNSLLILKLMYMWVWSFLFFVFLLLPLIAKLILISIPIAFWGIKKLRNKVTEKTQNFSITIKGIYAKGRFIDNLSTTVLFILYSLPSFWIGTLLIVFFTTKNYGVMFDWFPTSGVQSMEYANNPNTPFVTKYLDIFYHLFLPTFCITFSSFAYLSRQMRGAMLGVLRQDYIRTANSKGLSEHKVTWKHAFRNSLFPIITLFSSVFPRALSGAIAIELIYNIPGMGVLVLKAIGERDWPIVFTVAMLAAILTMIGNLIADILYAVVDPRISFK